LAFQIHKKGTIKSLQGVKEEWGEFIAMTYNALNILKNIIQIRREQWYNEKQIEKMQESKLEKILQHARKTEFYRDILKDVHANSLLKNLSIIPILEKKTLRKRIDSFIPEGVSKDSLVERKTSGTTGSPLTVYCDNEVMRYRESILYHTFLLYGCSPFDTIGTFTTRKHIPGPFEARTGLFKRVHIPLSLPEEEGLKMIKRNDVRILSAATSSLIAYAKRNSDVKLKFIYCGGEILRAKSRKIIEDSFSCPVYQTYAAADAGVMAYDCPEEKNVHVNCSSCIIEIVDSKAKPKKSGTGEVVVTSLYMKPLPILRYKIGDQASWGKECPCGRKFPVLEKIEGRKNDVIVLPSGRERSALELDYLFYLEVIQYQVVQEKPDHFIFRYVPIDNEISLDSKKKVLNVINSICLGEDVTVEFEKLDSIKPMGEFGKIKRLISKC
jgi:phenylacetate-CoA ligase